VLLSALYPGRPPRQFCFPEPVAQSDQFAKLSNESSCRFFDGGQPQFKGPHRIQLNPPARACLHQTCEDCIKFLRTGVRHPFPIKERPDIGAPVDLRRCCAAHADQRLRCRRELPQQRLFWNKSSIYQLNLLLRAGTPTRWRDDDLTSNLFGSDARVDTIAYRVGFVASRRTAG
jgi:hypothetical protein